MPTKAQVLPSPAHGVSASPGPRPRGLPAVPQPCCSSLSPMLGARGSPPHLTAHVQGSAQQLTPPADPPGLCLLSLASTPAPAPHNPDLCLGVSPGPAGSPSSPSGPTFLLNSAARVTLSDTTQTSRGSLHPKPANAALPAQGRAGPSGGRGTANLAWLSGPRPPSPRGPHASWSPSAVWPCSCLSVPTPTLRLTLSWALWPDASLPSGRGCNVIQGAVHPGPLP